MLMVDVEKWDKSAEQLRQLALRAEHPRSRERLMALYEICDGKNASQVGRDTQRNPQTVMEWVHRYNDEGPEAMLYRRSGGHPPSNSHYERCLFNGPVELYCSFVS